MPKIAKEVIAQIAVEMNDITDEQAVELAGLLRAKQPAVLQYLLSIGEGAFNEEERRWFLYLGISIWKMFSTIAPEAGLRRIEAAEFDKKAAASLELVKYLKNGENAELAPAFVATIETAPQSDILKYLLYALSSENGKKEKAGKSASILMFFFLKILVECLDGAIPEPA
jgi:hypothetical protein